MIQACYFRHSGVEKLRHHFGQNHSGLPKNFILCIFERNKAKKSPFACPVVRNAQKKTNRSHLWRLRIYFIYEKVPYRTKFRRTKLPKFRPGAENFVLRKFCPPKFCPIRWYGEVAHLPIIIRLSLLRILQYEGALFFVSTCQGILELHQIVKNFSNLFVYPITTSIATIVTCIVRQIVHVF